VRFFIKDNENFKNKEVRKSYGILACIIGMIINAILFSFKLSIGILLNSVSIMADAFNNIGDAATSAGTLISFKLANKNPDIKHPFGYGRIEYVTAFILSFVRMFIGYSAFKMSLDRIMNPVQLNYNLLSIVILSVSLVFKLWLTLFTLKIGKKIISSALVASGTEARNDCIVAATTIISLLMSKYLNLDIDGYDGLCISIFILTTGTIMFKETLSPLLGESVPLSFATEIKNCVESYEKILGTHDLIVHNYGPAKNMATIHAEVSRELSAEEAHNIVDLAEREIGLKLDIILTIHTDIVYVDDIRLDTIRRTVNEVLAFDKLLAAHDYRISKISDGYNVIFELIVPYNFKKNDIQTLEDTLRMKITEIDDSYYSIIKTEYGYVDND
jgi:cation diffusion facilitator family transporter